MTNDSTWHIRTADWWNNSDRRALELVRREVFIVEQQVPDTLEWDDDDDSAIHLLAVSANTPIGTARILASGQIGRMAVRKPWRGKGVGSALLQAAIDCCPSPPFLHAQVHAVGFYAAGGFVPTGETFNEAGILHQRMTFRPTLATPGSRT